MRAAFIISLSLIAAASISDANAASFSLSQLVAKGYTIVATTPWPSSSYSVVYVQKGTVAYACPVSYSFAMTSNPSFSASAFNSNACVMIGK